MFTAVLLPKSKRRDQLVVEVSRTQAVIVKLLSALTIPADKRTCWADVVNSVNWPFENVPPFGSVPFHAAPPSESTVVDPFVSLKLYRCANCGDGAVLNDQTTPAFVLTPAISSTRQ